jgi:transcriptional regulator with XRE-family HTH domain
MATAYIVPSNSQAMKITPGEFLSAELERLGLKRSDLAEKMGVRWPTVDRWTKDDGFTAKNRMAVAAALRLQSDHFEQPAHTVEHQLKCDEQREKFFASDLAPKDLTTEERASLVSVQIPLDREPTQHFYAAFLYLLRGQLVPSKFGAELRENESLARRAANKIEAISKTAKKKHERRKPPAKKRPSKALPHS